MINKLTYISLFSSAGVGCFGFKLNGFDCVATNELIERRLNVQICNNTCKYDSGYIKGDITNESIKNSLFNEIERYKQVEKIKDIDVVIATPPCQGMSVANHKKTTLEINRNSLVVEAIFLIKRINPRFFIFENVQAFMKTACYDNGTIKRISEAIDENLSETYEYISQVINFKNYGANSSRTRSLVIGVRNDFAKLISPIDLFPSMEEEKTLRSIIYDLPRLSEMGMVDNNDIYHGFKAYASNMRKWIIDLKEGESAFNNLDPNNRPHRIVDGKTVANVNKNGDKYTRQVWDKVAPCVHTRNDIMASQNTLHPEDDRVFSIRELMLIMNIPREFKWVAENEQELNNLTENAKVGFLNKNEINIRQSIGEAVPTIIMQKIAYNIKKVMTENNPDDRILKSMIDTNKLTNQNNLYEFIAKNENNLTLVALSRIAELSNSYQHETAAYYTDNNTLVTIFNNLPEIDKDEIRVLEPSVGTGNFIPFIIKKYEKCNHLIIDVCDIDVSSIKTFKLLLDKMIIPKNVEFNFINNDFLKCKFDKRYDLIIGNPPFIKMKKSKELDEYRCLTSDIKAKNMAAFFIEYCLTLSNYVVMILPKYFLHNSDFSECRNQINKYAINKIVDFGENGFKGVLIETICLFISMVKRKGNTECFSVTKHQKYISKQDYIADPKFPNWLLYRNDFFDSVSGKLVFGIFDCFRDRQITNKLLKSKGSIWVIKSRNICQDGCGLVHLPEYDSYVNENDIQEIAVTKYLNSENVFLSPNMTYYPRVIRKPQGTLVNGSVAIFELKENEVVNESDLKYFSSDEFREFYSIARNFSTRSLNLDNVSIYYFGRMV